MFFGKYLTFIGASAPYLQEPSPLWWTRDVVEVEGGWSSGGVSGRLRRCQSDVTVVHPKPPLPNRGLADSPSARTLLEPVPAPV